MKTAAETAAIVRAVLESTRWAVMLEETDASVRRGLSALRQRPSVLSETVSAPLASDAGGRVRVSVSLVRTGAKTARAQTSVHATSEGADDLQHEVLLSTARGAALAIQDALSEGVQL